MIPCVRIKEGVSFAVVSPGGIVVMGAFLYAAQKLGHDITITSACDGLHSGPEDPHHRGDALDCRTHDLPDKQKALAAMKEYAGEDHFFFWIEDEGGPNEHIHGQVKKGTVYPPLG